MDSDADFPAAHSMDCTWYAVDSDGHVGRFESGESGAVPVDAATDEVGDVTRQILRGLPMDEPVFRLDRPRSEYEERAAAEDRALPHRPISEMPTGPMRVATGRRMPPPETMGPTLLFLNSLAPVRDEIARGLAIQVPSGDGFAVVFDDLPCETARTIHAAGACLGCRPYEEYFEIEPERIGFYVYENPEHFYDGDAYERGAEPGRLLHVDQLSEELRALFLKARFDSLCFEETPRIQPIDHLTCSTWGCAYVDVDGKTVRAVPGREDEYREFYADWNPADTEYRLMPPPPG